MSGFVLKVDAGVRGPLAWVTCYPAACGGRFTVLRAGWSRESGTGVLRGELNHRMPVRGVLFGHDQLVRLLFLPC
jgi:hypothetical protein